MLITPGQQPGGYMSFRMAIYAVKVKHFSHTNGLGMAVEHAFQPAGTGSGRTQNYKSTIISVVALFPCVKLRAFLCDAHVRWRKAVVEPIFGPQEDLLCRYIQDARLQQIIFCKINIVLTEMMQRITVRCAFF